MEQISNFIQSEQIDNDVLDNALEDFDIDEILENEIKAIIGDATRTKITFQSIQNSRRYLRNGR